MLSKFLSKTSLFTATTMLLLMLTLSLTACNTISGAGKDLEAAGEALEEEAEENKTY